MAFNFGAAPTQPLFSFGQGATNSGTAQLGGIFGTNKNTGAFGAPSVQPPSNKLSPEDMNMDLQAHRQQIQETYDRQRSEFQTLSQQVFEQDKENYFTNQEVDAIVGQLQSMRQEQQQIRQAMQQVSASQSALLDSIQSGQETHNVQQIQHVYSRILQCQQALEAYKTAGLEQMKRINELSGYLRSVSGQLG